MSRVLLCIRKNVLGGLEFKAPKPAHFKSLSQNFEMSTVSINERWKAHVSVSFQGKKQGRFSKYIINVYML